MDIIYVALAILFWLLLVAMAVGCAKLEGAER